MLVNLKFLRYPAIQNLIIIPEIIIFPLIIHIHNKNIIPRINLSTVLTGFQKRFFFIGYRTGIGSSKPTNVCIKTSFFFFKCRSESSSLIIIQRTPTYTTNIHRENLIFCIYERKIQKFHNNPDCSRYTHIPTGGHQWFLLKVYLWI